MPDEEVSSDKTNTTLKLGLRGFTTVIFRAERRGKTPGPGRGVGYRGESNGDRGSKAPGLPLPHSPSAMGCFASSRFAMGLGGPTCAKSVDVDWASKPTPSTRRIPVGVASPRYDRHNRVLGEALEDHAVVLMPKITRRKFVAHRTRGALAHVNAAIFTATDEYEAANEIAAKKFRRCVD